jgi:YD repeat-containing protein
MQEAQIVPPDVWSFMKYGNVPVDMYTGAVNVSIPIYTYKDNDFEIPISIDYVSQGYIPNMPAGSLGVGWFLNAGGMITREVRDMPDEYYHTYENEWYFSPDRPFRTYEPNLREGYYSFHLKKQEISQANWLDNPYLYRDPDFQIPQKYVYRLHENEDKFAEMSPDIFTFNFMGHRGKFHMSDRDIVVYETTSPKGEYKVDLSGLRDEKSKIKIITGDGYIYTFGGLDSHKSESNLSIESWYCPFYVPTDLRYHKQHGRISPTYGHYIQWQLTSIEAPSGRVVSLAYSDPTKIETVKPGGWIEHTRQWIMDNYEYNNLFDINKGWLKFDKWLDAGPTSNTNRSFSLGVFKDIFTTRQLTSITINNSIISFNYDSNLISEISADVVNPPLNTSGGLRYLTLTSTEGSPVKTEETFAPGKLNSITIKHSNERVKTIDLGYGKFGTGVQKKLFLTSVNIPGVGKYAMDYINGNFPINGIPSVDYWGYLNNYCWTPACRVHGELMNFNKIGTIDEINQKTDLKRRAPNHELSKLGMLKILTYPTGGFSFFEYEPHNADTYVSRSTDENYGNPWQIGYKITDKSGNGTTKEVGGVRIKKIRSSTRPLFSAEPTPLLTQTRSIIPQDPPNDLPQKIDIDSILRNFQYDSSKEYIYGKGNVLSFPLYQMYYRRVYENNSIKLGDDRQIVSPLNLHIYSFDKTHIEYGLVKEKYGDGSYKMYKFKTYADIPDEIPGSIAGFKEEDSGEKYAGPDNMDNFTKHPISKAFLRGNPVSVISYDSVKNPVHAEYYTSNNYQLSYVWEWVPTSNVHAYKTIRYADNYKLGEKIESQYFYGASGRKDSISTKTTYTYNGFGQTSSISVLHPDGVTEKTRFRYLSSNDNTFWGNNLRDYERQMKRKNMISYLRYAYKVVNDPNIDNALMLTEGVEYNYDLQKIEVNKAIQRPYMGRIMNKYRLENEYTYDPGRRVIFKTDKNNVTTSYVWGYGGLYPVAVIEDSPDYSTVNSALGRSNGDLAPLSAALSASQENNLRKMEQGSVTTYKYKPLVGITEMTDPSGRKTVYEYHPDGRLKSVKNEGDTVSNYEYSTAN